MSHTPDSICELLDAGKITAKEAIAMFMEHVGATEYSATESIFIHLGGDDIVEVGDDGVERYARSGKPCSEVEAAMGEVGDEPTPNEDD